MFLLFPQDCEEAYADKDDDNEEREIKIEGKRGREERERRGERESVKQFLSDY